MGCDGGTIPKRSELVQTKKRKEKCSKDVEKAAKWNNCNLSQLPLAKPVVADLMGNLFNKDALIEYLLDKSKYEAALKYVKTLKDVKELKLTENPSFDGNKQETSDESNLLNKSKFICSITGLEMNGTFKFYFLFNCGCVFSERAYKTIQTGTDLKCLSCEKSFNENDLLIIYPSSEEDVLFNENKYKARKEAQAAKKSQKSSASSSASSSVSADLDKKSEKASSSKSSLTASSSSMSSKLKRTSDLLEKDTDSNSKKAKSAIQSDPNLSGVYKSIFNTCDKAQNQQKAHWVTFNPQYY